MIDSTLLTKIQSHKFSIWIKKKKWRYFDYQLEVVEASKKYNNILITSPTGTGKTIAGFLPSILNITEQDNKDTLHSIYISPLKSLAKDIKRNISIPINDMKMNINIDIRTGDTTSYNKRKIRINPPNFLITTPESFALLMSYEKPEQYFSSLKYIIIDELHNLIHTKRGDLLSLNLARLNILSPNICKIAMSATIKKKKEALSYISGKKKGTIISSNIQIFPKIKILETSKKIPWAGHMANYAIEAIYEKISLYKNTIIFVNTRAQSEYIFQKLWSVNNLNLKIGVHHGSLDKKIREKIENSMSSGKLNCIIATSSLELGIDWGNIDLIIQIGAPKGTSRILQRVGRSNHRIGVPSKAYMVPSNKFEYIECLAAINSIKLGKIEDRAFKEGSLDVLAQHLLGVACSQSFNKEELYNNIKSAFPYSKLDRMQYEKIINFVENGGYSLKNYNNYSKIKKNNNGNYELTNKNFQKKYRMNIGTIVEEQLVSLYLGNRKLGLIEEYFINNLSKGDTFIFAGMMLEFDKVILKGIKVKQTYSNHPKIPSYLGGKLPLSSELATEVLKLIRNYKISNFPKQIKNWLKNQEKQSCLPPKIGLLIETFNRKFRGENNNYIIAYTFQGRNVNQTLGMIILKELEEKLFKPIAFVATDYAIAVWSIEKYDNVENLFSTMLINRNLYKWLDKTSMVKKHFRNVATISGLIDRKYPGHIKTGKQITFNSDLIYDVLYKYEKNHILLESTKLEALNELIDYKRLSIFLKNIDGKIIHNDLKYISPLAVPLILEFNSEKIEKNKLISYHYEEMQDQLLKEANIFDAN